MVDPGIVVVTDRTLLPHTHLEHIWLDLDTAVLFSLVRFLFVLLMNCTLFFDHFMHSEQLASQVQGILLLQPRTPDGGHVHSGQAVHEEKVP